MHQLGRLGRCASTIVVALDKSDLEATRRSIKHNTGTCGTATDDKQVEAIIVVLWHVGVCMLDFWNGAVAHGLVRWHQKRLCLLETAVSTQDAR